MYKPFERFHFCFWSSNNQNYKASSSSCQHNAMILLKDACRLGRNKKAECYAPSRVIVYFAAPVRRWVDLGLIKISGSIGILWRVKSGF